MRKKIIELRDKSYAIRPLAWDILSAQQENIGYVQEHARSILTDAKVRDGIAEIIHASIQSVPEQSSVTLKEVKEQLDLAVAPVAMAEVLSINFPEVTSGEAKASPSASST